MGLEKVRGGGVELMTKVRWSFPEVPSVVLVRFFGLGSLGSLSLLRNVLGQEVFTYENKKRAGRQAGRTGPDCFLWFVYRRHTTGGQLRGSWLHNPVWVTQKEK